METVIVIIGPTASGKTKLSIELAKRLHGEIISADSMQVYRYMDIGTAKPDEQERQGIKHYLIDEVDPDEEFNVTRFQELALKYIREILDKGKTPVVVGGTGLYVDSLLHNINFSETQCDWELREELQKEAEEKGNDYLHDKLREMDPAAAEKIHKNNVKRVIRAIEVFLYTQKPISYHQEVSRQDPPRYRFIPFGLSMDRERLYDRINRRVDLMLENGLLEETKKLAAMGYDKGTTAMQAIGYKEILTFLRGENSLEESVNKLKQNTRNYAKRQITWFKRNEDIHWINLDQLKDENEIINEILEIIKTFRQ